MGNPASTVTFMGAPPTSTMYRIKAPGIEALLPCGADILLKGLQYDLDAEARCPTCGSATSFRIRARRIEDLQPPTALLNVVELHTEPGTTCILCEATHIFDRQACLRRWVSGYTGLPGLATGLQDYIDRCSRRYRAIP